MREGWIFVPVACVVGILIGSWRPRAALRAMTRQQEADKAAAVQTSAPSPDGFGSFARMVSIPDEAKSKPRYASDRPLFSGAATNAPASPVDEADASAALSVEDEFDEVPPTNAPPRRLSPEDLRARIAEAQELWSARVDIARAQWLSRLGMEDAAATQVFDDAVNGMNERLYALMQGIADDVEAGHRRPDHASGVRFISEVSGILAETYESIAAGVPEEKAEEVGKMPVTDFIDPAVAEPFVRIQDKFPVGPGGRGGL